MTREEVKKIIAVLIASYPNYKPNDMQMTVEVWASLLEDYDYKAMGVALKGYIATDTSGFAPSPGQLIAKYHAMANKDEKSEMEIWDMVRKAISDSTYHAEERFNELPILAQKSIGSPNQLRVWAMDEEYNDNVVQSNFLKTYRELSARDKEFKRMPIDIQNMITATTNNMIERKED